MTSKRSDTIHSLHFLLFLKPCILLLEPFTHPFTPVDSSIVTTPMQRQTTAINSLILSQIKQYPLKSGIEQLQKLVPKWSGPNNKLWSKSFKCPEFGPFDPNYFTIIPSWIKFVKNILSDKAVWLYSGYRGTPAATKVMQEKTSFMADIQEFNGFLRSFIWESV